MTEENETSKNDDVNSGISFKKELELKDVLALAGLFGLCFCTVNLSVYWSSFNINIFEFLSFSEVVGLAFPAIALASVSPIGFLLGILIVKRMWPKLFESSTSPAHRHYVAIDAQDSLFPEIRKAKIAWIIFVVFLGNFIAFTEGISIFWGVIAAIVMFVPVLILLSPAYHNLVKSLFIRLLIPAVITVFLITSAYQMVDAYNIKKNRKYSWIDSSQLKNSKHLQKQQRLKLIGHVGDRWFFVTMDNATRVIVKEDDIELLKIHSFIKGHHEPFATGGSIVHSPNKPTGTPSVKIKPTKAAATAEPVKTPRAKPTSVPRPTSTRNPNRVDR